MAADIFAQARQHRRRVMVYEHQIRPHRPQRPVAPLLPLADLVDRKAEGGRKSLLRHTGPVAVAAPGVLFTVTRA